jgi:hypothetical protein
MSKKNKWSKWKREIRFRGKRIDNGEWVHGFYLQNNEKIYIVCECETMSNDGENTDLYAIEWYEVIPETLGESTDIKDQEGNIAFEDDIIENEKGKRWCIRWGINSNGFIAKSNDAHCNVFSSYHLTPKTKIVGNIHDNLELM